jgi:hypothetical protein
MWLGMTKSKIYGPFSFNEATVTGWAYVDMLEQFLEPQLLQGGILNTVVSTKWSTVSLRRRCSDLSQLRFLQTSGLGVVGTDPRRHDPRT